MFWKQDHSNPHSGSGKKLKVNRMHHQHHPIDCPNSQRPRGDAVAWSLLLVCCVAFVATTSRAASSRVVITPAAGISIAWDGNNGGFSRPDAGAGPSNNLALASNGTIPFTSSDLGPLLSIPYHLAVNLNDGLYGNSHSWISANGVGGNSDPDPFVGVNFNGTVGLTNLAWSRDNGDNSEFTGTDRALGTYTLQITFVSAPDANTADTGDPLTGWVTVGTVEYRQAAPPDFNPHLRHRFDVSQQGNPIDATGLRIKVSNGAIDLDELEVNTAAVPPLPRLTIGRAESNFIISWNAGGGLEYATSLDGPWTCLSDAVSPYTAMMDTAPARFYRARR